MPTKEAIQELIKARLVSIKEASQNRDVDALMASFSQDIRFVDAVNGVDLKGQEAVQNFYTAAYEAMPSFTINEAKTTGFTPEFVVSEMKCESVVGRDLPYRGLKAGDTLKLTGVNLFWWRWEGPAEAWDGSLSEEAVRGWKIYEEHAYYMSDAKPAE